MLLAEPSRSCTSLHRKQQQRIIETVAPCLEFILNTWCHFPNLKHAQEKYPPNRLHEWTKNRILIRFLWLNGLLNWTVTIGASWQTFWHAIWPCAALRSTVIRFRGIMANTLACHRTLCGPPFYRYSICFVSCFHYYSWNLPFLNCSIQNLNLVGTSHNLRRCNDW